MAACRHVPPSHLCRLLFFWEEKTILRRKGTGMPDHTEETPTAQRKENGTWTLQNSRQEARSQAGDWAPSKGVRGQKPSAVPAGRKGGRGVLSLSVLGNS